MATTTSTTSSTFTSPFPSRPGHHEPQWPTWPPLALMLAQKAADDSG
jgi:hypothetical protein